MVDEEAGAQLLRDVAANPGLLLTITCLQPGHVASHVYGEVPTLAPRTRAPVPAPRSALGAGSAALVAVGRSGADPCNVAATVQPAAVELAADGATVSAKAAAAKAATAAEPAADGAAVVKATAVDTAVVKAMVGRGDQPEAGGCAESGPKIDQAEEEEEEEEEEDIQPRRVTRRSSSSSSSTSARGRRGSGCGRRGAPAIADDDDDDDDDDGDDGDDVMERRSDQQENAALSGIEKTLFLPLSGCGPADGVDMQYVPARTLASVVSANTAILRKILRKHVPAAVKLQRTALERDYLPFVRRIGTLEAARKVSATSRRFHNYLLRLGFTKRHMAVLSESNLVHVRDSDGDGTLQRFKY
jgi:hypothetical protein